MVPLRESHTRLHLVPNNNTTKKRAGSPLASKSGPTEPVAETEELQQLQREEPEQQQQQQLQQPIQEETGEITVSDFQGGRLRHFASQWEALTSDPEILQTVKGYQIDFESEPVQYSVPKEINFTNQEAEVVDSEIHKFLDKGNVEPTVHENGEFISNIFLRPKKEAGSFRMILNLRALNKFVKYEHFKMDGLDKAVKMMRQDCFMASMDLKDAYFSVPIHPEHQKYLKLFWRWKLFKFVCMPQGLACAPRVFTKLAKVRYSKLRAAGHESVGYIDDSYLQGADFQECARNAQSSWKLFYDLGFIIHPIKSVLTPVQILVFLEFVLNSIRMTVSLTQEKAQRLTEACSELLNTAFPTIRSVAQIVGSMVAAFAGVQFGPLYYRQLEIDRANALKMNRGNYETHMELSQRAKDDLLWWINNVADSSRPVSVGNPDITIQSDASTLGWGAALGSDRAGGRWSIEEAAHHINYLELLAAHFALQSFCAKTENKHVTLLVDNVTAVAHINNMGGSRSKHCNEIGRTIWLWCKDRNIWLSAAHIPGVCNTEADRESRIFHDSTEWMLNRDVFHKITQCLFVPKIDMFASRLNKQMDTYVSWRPDPMAAGVDAFSLDWRNALPYAFPPFSLISRTLQKLWEDQADAILVIPFWTTQSWFPQVMKSLVAPPIHIPAHRELLRLPYDPQKLHTLHHKLDLLACHLSGKPSRTKRFRQELRTSSRRRGGTAANANTRYTCRSGRTIVVNDTLIPFLPL